MYLRNPFPYAHILVLINIPLILISTGFVLDNEMKQVADGHTTTFNFLLIEKQFMTL